MRTELGVIVRQRREELGLTAQDVADNLGISRGLVSQWETQKKAIKEKYYAGLCDVLDMDIEDLTGAIAYVADEEGLLPYRKKIFGDHSLSPHVQVVLIWLSNLARERDGVMTYTGSLSRVADSIRSLTGDQVRAAWDGVLESPYVERHTDAEWELRLVLPRS